MARIVLGSYFVRYPLGGMMSWVLQYLVGLHRLGHDVCFVEKADYADACYDPQAQLLTDDPSAGITALEASFARVGLDIPWCFVDVHGNHHGMGRSQVAEAFRDADVFIDIGTHGAWSEHARASGLRVLIDGEPGFTQIHMERRLAAGETLPDYDRYFTVGRNVGTPASTAPTVGRRWEHLYNPVVSELFGAAAGTSPTNGAAFTTVMNWQAHDPIKYAGRMYGQKDQEFWRFAELPAQTGVPLEMAVSGRDVPRIALSQLGWKLCDAKQTARSVADYERYLAGSLGEFSVCKQVFLALHTGWFSDRSAAYLASGRPVIVQDTGFSSHLPCGEGLFAFRDAGEAAAALETVQRDWQRHSRAAVDIAREYLEHDRVLGGFLEELGV